MNSNDHAALPMAYSRAKLLAIASFWVSVFAVLYALIFFLGSDSLFWNYFDHLGLAQTEVCEAIYWDSAIRQPFSTFSNFPYLFFAVIAFGLGRNDELLGESQQSNTLLSSPKINSLFALNFLFIFAGSNFYHAALLTISNTADFFGVYASASLPLVYNGLKTYHYRRGDRKGGVSNGLVLFAGLVQLLFVVACLLFVDDFETILLTALGLIVLSSVWFHFHHTEKNAWLYLGLAVGLSGIAYACFKLDKLWCNPVSWIQGHFWWHVFSSTSIFFLYLFFRRERFSYQ